MVEGQIGILPNHVRLMTQMLPGEMMVRKDGRDQFLAVGEGLVEVTGERVAIATDMAVAVAKWSRDNGLMVKRKRELWVRTANAIAFLVMLCGFFRWGFPTTMWALPSSCTLKKALGSLSITTPSAGIRSSLDK